MFATFHDEAETARAAADTVGPFDLLTIRNAHVVGERAQIGTVIAVHGTNGRWRPADHELQLALEAERGDGSRAHIRVRTEARDLYVQLLDDAAGPSDVAAELGPFSIVDVGTHTLRADALIIAVRVATMSPWLTTDNAGADLAGISRRVLVLRRGSVPGVAAAPPADLAARSSDSAPASSDAPPFVWVERVRPPREVYISRPDVPRKR